MPPAAAAADVRFVVVGDVMTDVVALVDGPLRHGSDTGALITTHGGGSGANTAAWLATSGHRTAYIGRVGDDALGREALTELSREGVLTRVAVDPLKATGTCLVVVTPDGQRTMLPDAGANDAMQPSDLPDDLFRPGRHLHLSGYTLLHDGARLAGLAALDLARLRGMTVSIDPASAGPLSDLGPDRFVAWTAGAHVLIANEDEVAMLSGMSDPIAAGRSLTASFGVVVVKLGSAGAVGLCADDPPVSAPAVAVEITDTTGAGDAFAAGFLPGWLDGGDLRTALAGGNRVASRAVSRVGARP